MVALASGALLYNSDWFPGVTPIGRLSDRKVFGNEGTFSKGCCGEDILDDEGTPSGCAASGFDTDGGRVAERGCTYGKAGTDDITGSATEVSGMEGVLGRRFDDAGGMVDGREALGVT